MAVTTALVESIEMNFNDIDDPRKNVKNRWGQTRLIFDF